MLKVFERELVLLAARDGDLTGQADCLWRRTQGVIGSLTQLLTEAIAEAIDTGAERITPTLLDGIDIGYAAEVVPDVPCAGGVVVAGLWSQGRRGPSGCRR